MSIFGNLFGRFGRDYPRGNPGQAETLFSWGDHEATSLAGVRIDADAAVSLSTMFRAVHIVSSTIASFPIHIFEEQEDGSRKLVRYETDACVWRKPNVEMKRTEFVSVAIGHVVLNGNAFIFVSREPDNRYAFWNIEPERIEVARNESGKKLYRIDNDKIYYDFAAGGDIIHIAGWGLDGLVGVSPVAKMANAFGLAKATEEYASRYFANGTTIGGVLSTDQVLNVSQSKELKDRWDTAHRGLRNAHEAAVLSHGLKWQSTATAPEESQMTDVRQFQVAEIGRITGVPEHLIGSHDKTSSWGQGLEINNRAFLQFGLAHHMLRYEQAIDEDFLGTINDDTRYPRYMKFNQGALMRGTSAERAAFYTQMFSLGVYTVNMILALEDLPGIGDEGDIRFVPGNNLVPLGTMLNAAEGEEAPKSTMATLTQFAELLTRIQGPAA